MIIFRILYIYNKKNKNKIKKVKPNYKNHYI